MKYLKTFENNKFVEEWEDWDEEEQNFPDIPSPTGKMYILQHSENGMFLLNADLARNKLFTNDVRKARRYINLISALKTARNITKHLGKWILLEVDNLVIGNKKIIK